MHHEGYEERGHKGKGGMIREDHSKPSNLPQEYMNESYPAQEYLNVPVDDTMYAMDMQFNEAVMGAKRQNARKKY
jgi:hypothetical protein